MKKLLLISIMFIGLSTSAQIIYQPTFFGGSYLMDGQYVGETQFKSMLLKNPMAYNMWNEGTSNLTTGYIVLYSSSAVLGWGIGTSLGNSIVDDYGYSSDDSSGTPFIVVGGIGLIGAYYLMTKAQEKRERALFHYNDKKDAVGLKPIMNNNGGGFVITF